MGNRRAKRERGAATRDRTRDLQIFSLTLSQLSYRGVENKYIEGASRICHAFTCFYNTFPCETIGLIRLVSCWLRNA